MEREEQEPQVGGQKAPLDPAQLPEVERTIGTVSGAWPSLSSDSGCNGRCSRHDGASNGGRLIVTWNCKNNSDKTKTIEYEPMDEGIWRSKLEDPWYVHNLVKQQDLVMGQVLTQ